VSVRRPFGLRGRVLVAMVAVAGVTLLAAALALLPPLQDQLTAQTESDLQSQALDARDVLAGRLRPTSAAERADGATTVAARDPLALQDAVLELRNRIDGRVAVVDLTPRRVYDTDNGSALPEAAVYRTLATNETVTGESEGTSTIVTPLLDASGAPMALLVAQKRLTDVEAAVRRVREAFAAAALVGLAAAVLLAFALSTTLVRRLRRLRQGALRVMEAGPGAAPPRDEGRDEVGDLARALASMQDALGRQEQARRAFVATASHELRTPLTSIGWSLELLQDDLGGAEPDLADARAQVVGAQAQLRRLQRLAGELLDLSRLDADVPLRSEPVELGELTRAVAAEFERPAEDGGVAVEVARPPGPCWGRGDPDAIARIVRILLDNALRFAPAGSTVRAIPAYHGARATVAVADAGPGVPGEEHERIFERFERGSRAGREGGFGLGLAIGRELAERMGGELALDDRPGGPGARFVLGLAIEMPVGTPSAAGPRPAADVTSAAAGGGPAGRAGGARAERAGRGGRR
jgi:signal transduction histidine kinase